MKNTGKTGIWLKVLAWAAVIAAACLIGYNTLIRDADVLRIENGKIAGIKATWLTARFTADGQEERYYKLADVTAPAGYKTDRAAEDPDGDGLTTFFSFVGKDEEKNPGVVLIQGRAGSPEELCEASGAANCGELRAAGGMEGWLTREDGEAGSALVFRTASPYPEASIEITVLPKEGMTDEDALALLSAAAEKVTPGKQLAPLVADFKLNFLDDSRWTYLLNGLAVTLEITLGAVLLGIVIGILVATVRSTWEQNEERMRKGIGRAALSILNRLCKVYLTVIRGTPVVIQLMIMYYVIFTSSRNGVLIAMLAFGINSGAYVAEIIRGGIMSVDRGQLEAGRSLGFNYVQTMWHVIIPQAIKTVLPALANEFIVLLKETSVSGYVAVKDLTKGGDIIRGVTYSAFMPLLAVAAIYLIMVMFFTWLVGKLERRLRSSDH